MRLDTRTRTAIDALIELARAPGQGPVSLPRLGARIGASVSYLEQLFSALRRAGLVQAARGPGGGYRLVHPADETPLSDIVLAVHKPSPMPVQPVARVPEAGDGARLIETQVWQRCSRFLLEQLASITLAQALAMATPAEEDAQPSRPSPQPASPSAADPAAAAPARGQRRRGPPASVFDYARLLRDP